MKNFKIWKKLLVTFGVITVLILATVAIGIISLNSVGQNFSDFHSEPYRITNVTKEMRAAVQATSKFVGYAIMTDDVKKTAEYIDESQAQLDTLKPNLQFLYENFTGDKKLLDDFKAAMDAGVDAKDRVFEYAKESKNDEAAKVFFDEYEPCLLQAQNKIIEISNFAETQAEETYDDANESTRRAYLLLIGVSVAAIVLTIWLALYLIKSLTKPIEEIETAAKEMANGSLTVSLTYESKDELGQLSDSMKVLTGGIKTLIQDMEHVLHELSIGNFLVDSGCAESYIGEYVPLLTAIKGIQDSLSNTLLQINQASEQVSVGSDQVSSSAQALAQGATEQASSVEELSATIAGISAQIKQNAENAQIANKFTEEAGAGVTESNQHMQEMIEAMGNISSKSSEIGKIIKTIDDIAFQTNILALNAAVEAARAGAAGKGFAVVADEVRNLAQKSAEAAKNTTVLIEDTVNAVDSGTKIADETARSLQMVVEKSAKVVEKIDEIAKASDEQANAAKQVTIGIEQISSVVQTNSATAEESAAASEELSGQAQMLKDLVGQFKLKNDYEDLIS